MTLDFGTIVTIVVSVVGATWVLRSKLSSIETALQNHITASNEKHDALVAKVIQLEGRRTAKRNK